MTHQHVPQDVLIHTKIHLMEVLVLIHDCMADPSYKIMMLCGFITEVPQLQRIQSYSCQTCARAEDLL